METRAIVVFWRIFVLLLLQASTNPAQAKCIDLSNCECFQDGTEYQCSKAENRTEETFSGTVVHLHPYQIPYSIEIDCIDEATFGTDNLPGINGSKYTNLQIAKCPLQNASLQDITKKLLMQRLERLTLTSTVLPDSTVTSELLEGFGSLRSVALIAVNISSLNEDVFDDTPKLEQVEVNQNNIEFLEADMFQNTRLLDTIDLSNNRIEELPEGLFRNLKRMKILKLWGNRVSAINSSTFEGLSNLTLLILKLNRIESIAESSLSHLVLLKSIDLSRNRLSTIPGTLFRQNKLLFEIRMEDNPNLQLPNLLFSNLPSLKELSLRNCSLTSIPTGIFAGSPNLRTLNLERNLFKTIHENYFATLSNIRTLKLNDNKIEGFALGPLKTLEVLHLQNNLISAINEATFIGLPNLRELHLERNKISFVHLSAFSTNGKLAVLNLSRNEYSFKGYPRHRTPFDDCVDLEVLDLSHNLIEDMDSRLMSNKVQLRMLDVSHNHIKSVELSKLQPVTLKEVKVRLEYNEISSIKLQTRLLSIIDRLNSGGQKGSSSSPRATVYLNNNPISCDCHIHDMLKYHRSELHPIIGMEMRNLLCSGPPNRKGRRVLDLRPEDLVCPTQELNNNSTSCPQSCACSWRPFDTSLVVNCAYKNLSGYPDGLEELRESLRDYSINQTDVDLEGNNLTRGPSRNLSGYDTVTKLVLSRNRIQNITWLPPNLEMLTIDHNELRHLSYEALRSLNQSRLSHFILHGNPWMCDCDSANLSTFLRQHSTQTDSRRIFCFNSTQLLVDNNAHSLCSRLDPVPFIIAFVMTILFLCGVAFALFYRYEEEVKVWLFAKGWFLRWIIEEDLDKNKEFDAFVSFSPSDEDFVTKELVPTLEQRPNPYKLCLHYRHFIPGDLISDQIVDAVNKSKRTIVVVSPNFVNSVWGKMEFRTAHTNAMSEGRARVIVILYGDVDVESLDETLKSYVKTRTYAKWGKSSFWRKLYFALPHSKQIYDKKKKKRSKFNYQKYADVMNKIDNGFSLQHQISSSTMETSITIDDDKLMPIVNGDLIRDSDGSPLATRTV